MAPCSKACFQGSHCHTQLAIHFNQLQHLDKNQELKQSAQMPPAGLERMLPVPVSPPVEPAACPSTFSQQPAERHRHLAEQSG